MHLIQIVNKFVYTTVARKPPSLWPRSAKTTLVVCKMAFDAQKQQTQRPNWTSQKSDFSEK